ncbi:ADYC domain-containing protein [Corallococcus sp. AS-1-12]|uniref:ADYC domain-containing protein n=1 Tax=Corallococcus sp. AS-1-12 TaxID=2874598 RepID=UPI001CBC31CF|nr:hypothetical protein [Corallococcus sp. AS-1-12]
MKLHRVWFGCLALMMGSGGCRLTAPVRVPPNEAKPEPSGASGCPTGQCDPDPNGLGIYIAEGQSHCFVFERTAPLCPEGFVNTPEGVRMRVRSREGRRAVLEVPVELAGASGAAPRLHGIHATPTDLFLAVAGPDGDVRKLRGTELAKQTFTFSLPVTPADGDPRNARYEMRWTPLGASRFQVHYRQVGMPDWRPQCAAPEKQRVASLLLPGRHVDGLNAAVQPDASAVTLACETGAIGACLDWGYPPWDPASLMDTPERAAVYGACLQAKRAAYFVGLGDARTFTVSGTDFLRRDAHGFGTRSSDRLEELEHLEALWSPQGAVCLNPENRRTALPLPAGLQLPPCGAVRGWSAPAVMATGVPHPLKQ